MNRMLNGFIPASSTNRKHKPCVVKDVDYLTNFLLPWLHHHFCGGINFSECCSFDI